MPLKQIAVIGLGNPFRGDDVVGLEVIRRLRRESHPYIRTSEVVSDVMDLVAAWEGCETAIVVDAMVTGLEPGAIQCFGLEEVIHSPTRQFPSTHGFGLLDGLRLAQALDRLPDRLVVVGIEGSRFDVGEPMSPMVMAAVEPAVEQVLREVRMATEAAPLMGGGRLSAYRLVPPRSPAMHEIGIAASVLEAVKAELAQRPGSRGVEVGLKVGELSGVEPEALRFSFQALLAGSDLAELRVEIEACPRRYRCPVCGLEYVGQGWELACPECGALKAQCIGGSELELSYLELEEP